MPSGNTHHSPSATAQQRRRLTVSQCDPVPQAKGAAGRGRHRAGESSSALSAEQQARLISKVIEKNGFEVDFQAAERATRRVVSIFSQTDKDMKRKRAFGDKDIEVVMPGHAKTVESDPDRIEAETGWVRDLGIGWACQKGMKPESPNQDSFSLLVAEGAFALYGVFDGHGPNGHDVSEIARMMVPKLFLNHAERDSDTGAAFKEAFENTQHFIQKKQSAVDANTSGTTCSMAYHDFQSGKITVAHVGDSRCVLGIWSERQGKYLSLDLTVDHKPNLAQERQRIESSRPPGRVIFDGFFNHRVFAQNGMYPGLNMSRALGDITAHVEAGLSATPDVTVVDLVNGTVRGHVERTDVTDPVSVSGAQQAFEEAAEGAKAGKPPGIILLLCSDGVWEFINSCEAYALFQTEPNQKTAWRPSSGPDSMTAMRCLAGHAWERWMADSEHEISDDITGLMVQLDGFFPPPEGSGGDDK